MNAIVQANTAQAANPFQRPAMPGHANAGAVMIESERAVAEAQGKLVVAKKFPRDQAAAYSAAMEACKRRGLAETAVYSFPRGGQTVSGPSIRLAEELARCWGNIDYGIRELSRKEGVSEMEAYAWDLQTNTISSQKFTVRHIRDKRGGNQALTDERDIYELTANMGGRRLRARILAILPPDLVDDAVKQCAATMAGNSDEPMADRVRRMLRAFDKLGVSQKLIEKRLGHSLDECLPEELAELQQIHNSVRDGMTRPADWFASEAETEAAGAVANLNAGIQSAPSKPAKPKKQAPAQEEPPQAPAQEEAKPTSKADDGDIF